MKLRIIGLITLAIVLNSCSNGQTQSAKAISATEFAAKLKEFPSAPIVDVRTPGEFSKGHLQYARNISLNSNNFTQQISTLDKTKPVFVYCLSGSRSAYAADRMKSMGFTEVYDLNGGLLKWRSANLPETTDNTLPSTGMNRASFTALLNSDKLVLVDFYADWCAPCKKMEPYLKEISNDMADKVVIVRINADDNQELCKELKINALPVLQLYKNKTLTWTNTGYIEKAEVVKQLK
jgi:thioredoxin 1